MDRDTLDEIKRHFGVVSDSLRDDIRALAEGQQALRLELTKRIDGFEAKVDTEFQEVKAMIRFSFAELDRRVRTLETDVSELRGRLEQVEARLAT